MRAVNHGVGDEDDAEARFQARLEAISHGMDSSEGVNAVIDARIAALDAAAAQRSVELYQQWRMKVFEPIQSAVQARTGVLPKVEDPLKAALHAHAQEHAIGRALGVLTAPNARPVRETVQPEQFACYIPSDGGRWTDSEGNNVMPTPHGSGPMRVDPYAATPSSRLASEEAARAAHRRKGTPEGHPATVVRDDNGRLAAVRALPERKHDVPRRPDSMGQVLLQAHVVRREHHHAVQASAVRTSAPAGVRTAVAPHRRGDVLPAKGPVPVGGDDVTSRLSRKMVPPPTVTPPAEGRRHLRYDSGIRDAKAPRGMYDLLADGTKL